MRLDEWRTLLRRAEALEAAGTDDPRDAVTLSCALHLLETHIGHDEAAAIEHTLSPMADGPAVLLLLVSQTRLQTPQSAQDYLQRVRGFASYVDGCAERLRQGLGAGQHPGGDSRAGGARPARRIPRHTGRRDGRHRGRRRAAGARRGGPVARRAGRRRGAGGAPRDRPVSRAGRRRVAAAARDDEHCGILHLPRGTEDYDRLVRVHTTLPFQRRRSTRPAWPPSRRSSPR